MPRQAGSCALFLALAAIGSGLSCSASKGAKKPNNPKQLTLLVTTELQGNIEPCGCTSDPMGDLARTAELVARARSGGNPVLVLDGGSTLFGHTELPTSLAAQEKLKAEVLTELLTGSIALDAAGLGPYDLAAGKALSIPRHAVNVPAGAGVPLAAPVLIDADGVTVGIFGAVDPTALAPLRIEARDPIPDARAAVADLRKRGAVVVVALLHMVRGRASDLVKAVPGIDFALVGRNAPEPDRIRDEPFAVGDTWLFQPANRGQIVSRLELSVRGSGRFHDAIGVSRAAIEIERIAADIERLEAELARWKADPSADPSFLATKDRELAGLRATRTKLSESPTDVPAEGPWFVFEQVRIKKGLPCSANVVSAKRAYDKAAGDANAAAAAGVKPTPAEPGTAGYVGVEECAFCHEEAVAQWKTTKHFDAWETLVKDDKQLNLDCIGCHVTGFSKPGGANLGFNESLRDIQCETCHGPGSLHVDADGKGHIALTPAEELCVGCHNEKHSDTFQFEAYLRDVTGKGHAEEFRAKLGDGPTGHELRSAALQVAGAAIGKGCPK